MPTDQNAANDTANNAAITAVSRQQAGLRPWQPGQSGNPSGRPKKKPITEAYDKLLESQPELAESIAQSVVKQILSGSKSAAPMLKELTDRVEGKVAESIEHSGAGGGPIRFEIGTIGTE